MFEAVPMQKVRVVALRKQLDSVVERLHSEGIVDLRESSVDAKGFVKIEIHERLSKEFLRLRGIKEALGGRGPVSSMQELSLDELLSEVGKIDVDARLKEIESRTDGITKRSAELESLRQTLKNLISLKVNADILSSSRYSVFLGTIQSQKLNRLKKSLSSVSGRFLIDYRLLSGAETLCIISCDSALSEKFEFELGRAGFFRLPLDKVSGEPVRQLKGVEAELSSLRQEKLKLESEVSNLSAKFRRTVICLTEMLEAAYAREGAKRLMSTTENVSLFEGWVIKKDFSRLKAILDEVTFGRVLILPVESREEPPTVLQNPAPMKPFERMVDFLSTSKAREKDPTIPFAFFFLLIYGMMLGDVGYGILSFILAYLLSKKIKGMVADLARVWMYASIPTIIFGVLFDEYFGLSHEALAGGVLYQPLLRRAEDVPTMLVLALALGCVQLIFGFFLSFLNLRRHDSKHALSKILWILLVISGVSLAVSLSGDSYSALRLPSLVVAAGCMLGIILTEGVIGLFEVAGVAGNILSYARIMAVGMSSVVMASIINATLKADSTATFLLILPIILVMHLLNTAIGMFESSIQSARLNYVEFFSKFFEGGGRKFSPFLFNRVNTYKKNKEVQNG